MKANRKRASQPCSSLERFDLPCLLLSSAAREALDPEDILSALGRLARFDWGEIDQATVDANERAMESGGRLVGLYRTGEGRQFSTIFEADRSGVCFRLLEEYPLSSS